MAAPRETAGPDEGVEREPVDGDRTDGALNDQPAPSPSDPPEDGLFEG